jgi:hypothetical protein
MMKDFPTSPGPVRSIQDRIIAALVQDS